VQVLDQAAVDHVNASRRANREYDEHESMMT